MKRPAKTPTVQDAQLIANRLVKSFGGIDAVLLFGSVARGDANQWSDIDLLVTGSDASLTPAGVPQVSPGLRDLGSYRQHDSTDVVRGFGPGPRFAKTGQTWGTPRSRLSAHLWSYTSCPNVGQPPKPGAPAVGGDKHRTRREVSRDHLVGVSQRRIWSEVRLPPQSGVATLVPRNRSL